MADYKNIPLGLRTQTQIPLDVKEYIQNESLLSNLGVNGQLAYTYTKGLVVYCIEESTRWEWTEVKPGLEDTGLINQDFIYPDNHIAFGIDYSNKRYNFVKVISGSETKINAGDNITVIGTGTTLDPYIINSLSNGKEISSSSLIITEDDFSINIETPTLTIGTLKTFYVNSNYSPTVDSSSDGSIIRPYVSYDEAKTAFIGTGTLVKPEFSGATIVLQTSSNTVTNPTVNNLRLKFENNAQLMYTGTDLYMFDTEVLYPLIPKGIRNELTLSIIIELTGKGSINRNNGIGMVRGMGSNRTGTAIVGDPISSIFLANQKEDDLIILERIEYPSNIWDGNTTNSLGVTYESVYGRPHKYSLQLPPTIPLVYTKYNNLINSWGVSSYGGKITIITLANTAIKIDSVDTLFYGINIKFKSHTDYISTTSATKFSDFTDIYAPHSNKNYVEASGTFYAEVVEGAENNSLSLTGVDNFFKFTNNARFDAGVLKINTKEYVNTFINISDISNTSSTFTITNNVSGSNIKFSAPRTFINTNRTSINIIMPNSFVTTFLNKSISPCDITIITDGTISSFFGNPVISGIQNYVNDTAAITAGLVINSLYFNTINNTLDLVS